MKSKLILAVSAASLAIAVAAPVQAQDSGSSAEDGDIIVTARRVEERLQDVPISITVYNQEDIAKRNIVIAADLATYTPSLSVNQQYGPDKSSFALRGFNQDSNTAPTVGTYFADVVGVRAQGGTTSGNSVGAGAFTDLQNVQVLKGPQGTLFGRNTTGGAVLLVPTKPTGDLSGYVEGSVGNYDLKRVQAALNIPLADTFKVRLAVDRNKRDGYLKNMAPTGPRDFHNTNYTYARLSIVADLTPDLENYTIFHYSKSDTNGFAGRITACDRNPIDFTDATGRKNPASPNFDFTRSVFAVAACNQLDRQAARGDSRLQVEIRNPRQFTKIEQWQAINTTTWKASDTLTLKNIMSYGEFREHGSNDIANLNLTVPAMPFPLTAATAASVGKPLDIVVLDEHPGYAQASQSTFTEELQLQGGSADGRLEYVVGGYLEFSRPISWNSARAGIFGYCTPAATLNCDTPLGFAIVAEQHSRFAFDNHGVFGQATYKLTDQLALTGGIRWTFDKIVGDATSSRYVFSPIPGLGNQIVAWNCNDGIRNKNPNGTPINLASTAFGGDGSGDTSKCHTRLVNKSNKPTWTIDLDYNVSPDVMIYGKWSRGYRQGGMTFTNPGLETWKPENLDSYEVGVKSSFRGAVPGYFNLAAFYNDFTNQQVITSSIPKPGSGLSGGNVVANAGKSEIYGVEVDAAATLFERLKLTLGYTYLHTKVKEFVAPILPPDSPFLRLDKTTDVGLPLTMSPKHRLTASATYSLPLDESLGKVDLGATFTYTAKQNANFSSTVGWLPSTSLLNLNLDWSNVANSGFDLALFATNVTNKIYPVSTTAAFGAWGFDMQFMGQPRMYGMRVKYRFGS